MGVNTFHLQLYNKTFLFRNTLIVKTLLMTLIADAPGENLSDIELFFRSSKDLFCIAGFDGYFKKVNPAVLDTLGYTQEELFEKPIKHYIYEEDQLITGAERENLVRGGTLRNFENRYLTKSGDVIWLSWTSVSDVKSELVFAVAKNVTYKKLMEAERIRLYDELHEDYQRFKDLVSTVIHDLRAPATNIVSVFKIYEDLLDAEAPNAEGMALLKTCVDDLNQRLNEQLDRIIDTSQTEAVIDKLDLKTACERSSVALRALIADCGATLQTDFSAAPFVTFNQAYLDSIFLNLITNSIKYARPDVPLIVELKSKPDGDYTQLIVKDNGRGFNKVEFGEKVFQFKQRFHEHANSKGVGLYLIKKHLMQFGGEITVDSEEGLGTTFLIRFKN